MTGVDVGPARPVRAGIVAVVVLPIVVAVVRALARHWFPIGDDALLYIRVRDVATGQHPLLGSWTSASLSVGTNMNNPGPIYQDLLAPVAHLFSPGPGAAIGVGLANIGAIIGTSAAGRHIGGWPMQRWVLLACAALSWTMGSELLFDIWQAHALLLPFMCFLVLLVGIAHGRARCVPWALAVASVLVQTHISYAYIVGTLTPVAIAVAWWDHRPLTRAQLADGLRSRTAVVGVVVVAVLWSQSFVEQLFGEGEGNLSRLVANSGGGDVQVGARNAAKIVAAVVALPPWWLRRGFSSTVPSTKLSEVPGEPSLVIPSLPGLALAGMAIAAMVGALLALTLACRRAGMRLQSHALVLSAAGVVMAVLCLSLLTVGRVGLAAHHVRWVWSLAVFVQVAAAWAVVSLVVHRLDRRATDAPRAASLVTPAVLAVVAVFTVLNLPYHAQDEGPVADRAAMPALRRVFRQMDAAGDELRELGPLVYDISNLRVFEPYSSTIMMRLQELDVEFRVTDEAMVRQLGNGRRADGTETSTIFQLEGSAASLYDSRVGCPLYFAATTLGDVEDRRAAELGSALQIALIGGSVSVDIDALGGDERALADAALGGDEWSASVIIRSGLLAQWIARGVATIDPSTLASLRVDTAEAFAVIDRWVAATYAVVITRPGASCD